MNFRSILSIADNLYIQIQVGEEPYVGAKKSKTF